MTSTAEQEIQFFTTSDGVRIAYTIGGSGPPLVRAIDWLNHLDFEWKNPLSPALVFGDHAPQHAASL